MPNFNDFTQNASKFVYLALKYPIFSGVGPRNLPLVIQLSNITRKNPKTMIVHLLLSLCYLHGNQKPKSQLGSQLEKSECKEGLDY